MKGKAQPEPSRSPPLSWRLIQRPPLLKGVVCQGHPWSEGPAPGMGMGRQPGPQWKVGYLTKGSSSRQKGCEACIDFPLSLSLGGPNGRD